MAIVCSTSKPEVVKDIDTGGLTALFAHLMMRFDELLKIRREEMAARLKVKEVIANYEQARAGLCRRLLETSGRGWCGDCESVYESVMLAPVYVESWDYESCDYGYDPEFVSAKIIKACPDHYIGKLFSMGSSVTTHHFQTRFKDGKYLALLPDGHNRKSLNLNNPRSWQTLGEEVVVAFWPDRVSLRLTKELGLPPVITFIERSAGWKIKMNPDGSYSYTQSGDGDDYLIVSDK